MDIVTWILCRKYAKNYTDEQISIIAKGMSFKGSVPTIADLPLTGNTLGDLYLVEDEKIEYVWTIEATSGVLDNWKDLGKIDLSKYYTKAEVDARIPDISGKADISYVDSEILRIENEIPDVSNKADISYVNSEITRVEDKIPDVSGFATKIELAEKQDKLSTDTREDYKGIIINNNVIGRDPDIIPSVDYVDASITDTMHYIDQQDASEHAGRVAGDNLLQAAINTKQNTIEDLDEIREGAALGATAVQHNELVLEAGTGEHSAQAKDSQCFATGDYSFAGGYGTQAEANYAHTEGFITKVPSDEEHDARYGHAEGYMTEAAGLASHAEGDTTYTQNIAEHAQGRGNKSHKDSDGFGSAGNTIHSIGIALNNQDITTFKNAQEIMQNGDQYVLGIGNYDGKNIETAKTLQEVVNNKQNKVKVNEANPTTDLNSLTIDNVIYKIAGEAKIEKTFTTDIAVGHLAAGTTITSNMAIKDILFAILCGTTPPSVANIYYGATDNIPTGLTGLTKVDLDELPSIYSQNIIAGHGTGRSTVAQHPVFAIPDNRTLTKWVRTGTEFELVYNFTHVDGYNIYYLESISDDRPDGIPYTFTILSEPAKPAIYYGALSETQLPPSLANLTKVDLSTIPAKFTRNIVAGTGEGRYALGQHSTFAVPNNYKITSWIVEGLPDFELISNAIKVQADNYNIYYLDAAEDNRPNGTNYEITIELNN